MKWARETIPHRGNPKGAELDARRNCGDRAVGERKPLAGVPKDTIFGMPLTDPAAPVFLVLPVGGNELQIWE